MKHHQQLSLAFEPGMTQRARNLREHLATRIYAAGLVRIAGEIDCAPSHLTEKLAGSDSSGKPRNFSIDELERYMERTRDYTPIYYLVERYLQDPQAQQQVAIARLTDVLEALPGLAASAGMTLQTKPVRKSSR